MRRHYSKWYAKKGLAYHHAWQTAMRKRGSVRAQESLQNSLGAMLRSVRDCEPRASSKLRMFGVPSMSDLLTHLENMWDKDGGMTWDNYGRPAGVTDRSGWVIDHIIPKSWYDASNPDDLARCWNYQNLRPCWDIPNSEKKDSRPSAELLARVPAECYPIAGLRGDTK